MRSKKNFKKIISLGLLFAFLVSSVFFVAKKFSEEQRNDSLINIAYLSEEFVDNYLEEYKEIKKEDKDNILIITSKENIEETYGATKVIEAPNHQYILQYANEENKNKALSEFSFDESIISAEENGFYTIEETTYNSWGVSSMALDYAMTSLNGENLNEVTVAIIDTGLDLELANKYYSGKIAETYNVLEKSTTKMTDENGHGTHVFGTIAEGTPSNVRILPIKVSEDGKMYYTDIIAAIDYIVSYEKADVINMSFGGYGYNQALEVAIESAKQNNIISVAAAGNNNTSANHYPSALDNTISIASVDSSLNKSSFSNHGSKIDFTAPGTNIKSIMSSEASISKKNGNVDGDNDHETISGTSMATPHAVAAVAILKSFNKDLTLDNTVKLLQSRAVDLGDMGWDKYYGYGLVSFENAEFCDGTDCDEYNVFKESSEIVPTGIEIQYVLRTTYNYGTPNNFNPSQVRVYDSTGSYTTTSLGNLSGVEITGYDAYSPNEQVVTVKWQGLETSFNFTNPTDWNSGWTYKIIENNDIIITGFTDFNLSTTPAKKLFIPETIDGHNVVAIGKESSNTGIFGNASKASYEEIVLPSSLTEIKGKYTLSGFNYVKKITALSNSLKISGYYIFADNSSLVEVAGTIESLGTYTFDDNISLQKVTLSDNITELPNGAFYHCSNLENINIPSKLVSIGDSVFTGDFKLNNITLPEGLKTIGNYAFWYTNIENITLPDSLEQIGERAFSDSNIRNLSISKNLTSIGENAFLGCSSLESIVVDEENPVYDSRENCNALIDTETNTLLKGISSTKIPNTITKIGDNAYSYDLRIEEIEIPNNIIEIGNSAFYDCNYLTKIKIPRSVQIIGNYALLNHPAERQDMDFQQIPLTVLTYNDAYAKTYAVANEINYETLDYTAVIVQVSKREYQAFDKVNNNEDITNVMLQYNIGKTTDSSYRESRIFKDVSDGINVNYINNNDSFRYGDAYYIVSGKDMYGESFEKQVTVTISKANPKYTIPTNLRANLNQKLSEIILPEGFEWMNPDEIVEEEGNIIFKAKYTPSDAENYKIVENIEISVSVKNPKEIIEPNIVIGDKTYDGSTDISVNNITISNLEKSEYSIESVISSSADVGDRIATIKIKLTDEKFKNYTFADGTQEKEFIIDFKLVPEKLKKPTLKITEYTYNGVEQSVELNDYQKDKMNISGNTRTNAGEQDVTISLKSNNYVWNDNSSDDVILKFKIDKADPNIKYLSSGQNVKYDGKLYGINLEIENPNNTKIKYMDGSGEYTLDEMPKYTEIGSYPIKFKLFVDDNYIEIFDEEVLIITNNTLKNNTTDFETIYDGKEHTINIKVDLENYNIKYSINNYDYNLNELPKFKEVGEYTINYKITSDNYDDLFGSNKVKIYGIESIDSNLVMRENVLIIKNSSLADISYKIKTFAKSTSFNHYDRNWSNITSGNIKTSDIIKITVNNTKDYSYTLSLLGDVNADGKISSADYVKIRKHIMQTELIKENVYFYASDVNSDNKISSADYVKIRKYIMNGDSL
ncbi:MAG: leucine-rich repeat protein [Bacilli bacterium]|nr:leucine-rich repeat protein [Bacilli bacterium]